MNDHHEKLIFLEAIEFDSDRERSLYVQEACGTDTRLRAEVDALLRAHNKPRVLLDAADHYSPTVDPPIKEGPGTVIGLYKLVQQIGEGGMGVVFMAEQTRPVQRTVALKIIKQGMDTQQVITRFEAERQALAMMDHPNIAHVLDAGSTDTGRPYFVMELVKGIPITDYCDQHHLSIRQRLELMTEVCHAVQHAHQKGLIHRDLKPSNVLVAEYDGKPVPKIIDFGVAKATAERLTERTLYTNYGQIVGTFEYMSPEQAKLNQLDVDTRSDIYSLGVLLYELLTGSTPFAKQRLATTPFDETLRIIREEEPPAPSARLSTSRALPTIAESRQSEPAHLSRLVRGELDWIVMKALDKDRNRRYETVGALVADVSHYLADEPVTAGPPSRLYRAGKFVRRNRVPVVATCLVIAAILGGIAASTWQAIRATRAERAALAERDAKKQALSQAIASAAAERAAKEREAAERKQAEALSNFLIGAFQTRQHDIQAVAETLKHSAKELQDAYSDSPAAAPLIATIGRSYVVLRQFDEAESMFRKCLAVATDAGLIEHVRHELAACLLRQGKSDEGGAILQNVFLEKLKRSDDPDAIELREAWSGLPDVRAMPQGKEAMSGLELDGYRDYVVLPRLYFDGRPPWTLEAIVRPAEIDQLNPDFGSSSGWTSLISATDDGGIALHAIWRRWAIELFTTAMASDNWTKNYARASARNEVALHEWQHVAGVWDGKELRLYHNGQLQGTGVGVDYCSGLCWAPMFLGADPDSFLANGIANGYLHGRLHAVRISRSIEYTDTFPRPERLEKTPGTIGLYDFTVDTGRYAIDRSGHGNHGIIIGAKYAKDGIQDLAPVEAKESKVEAKDSK